MVEVAVNEDPGYFSISSILLSAKTTAKFLSFTYLVFNCICEKAPNTETITNAKRVTPIIVSINVNPFLFANFYSSISVN